MPRGSGRLLLAATLLAALAVAGALGSRESAGAPGERPLIAGAGAVVVEGGDGIYVVNVDGSSLTRLTKGDDHDPVWSPDGTRIAFSRIEADDDPVLVMNADGRGLRRVGAGERPQWSPVGDRIAFEGDGVRVVNADGTGARRLTRTSGIGIAWSPDGTRIAYSDGRTPSRIHVVEVATGAATTLGTASFEQAWGLAWSPDGAMVAFDGGGLVVVDVASGEMHRLTSDQASGAPAWSSDSGRIAIVGRGTLRTIRRDGSDERRLTSVGDILGTRAVSWMADGGLVYEKERFAGSSETDVWRIRADGSDARSVTRAFPTGASYAAPQWSATTLPATPEERVSWISLRASRSVQAPTAVLELAADGRTAAFATDGAITCGPVGIWRAGGRTAWLAGSAGCGDATAVANLAVAGDRAAWTYEEDTNTIHATVLVVGRPGSRTRELTVADHDDDRYLGGLSGDGQLLVFDTWKETWPNGYRRPGVVAQSRLWRIAGSVRMHPQPLAAGTLGARLVSVDAGRIALQRRDGTLVVLSAAGRRVGGFRLGAQGVEAVRLTGSRIVALRRATIEVRDALRGATIRRWTVGRGIAPLSLEDAQGNFAVYVEGIALHVLRLSDGRDRVLALADQAGPTHAELEPEGLYYSYNATGSSKPGRVAFVPFAELAAQFDEAAVRPLLVRR